MTTLSFLPVDSKRDFEIARSVHHRVYRDVVLRQFGAWNEPLQNGFFEQKWYEDPYQMILLDGVLIGFLSVIDKPDCVFLSEIQILPEYQGQGIGSRIIRELQDRSSACKLPLRLQVLHENQALKLYKRHGFIETSRTDTHVLMEWKER